MNTSKFRELDSVIKTCLNSQHISEKGTFNDSIISALDDLFSNSDYLKTTPMMKDVEILKTKNIKPYSKLIWVSSIYNQASVMIGEMLR